MIFKLNCLDYITLKKNIIFYENEKNIFFNENFEKFFKNESFCEKVYLYFGDDNPYKFDKIEKLHLMVGYKCNFDCKYCPQKKFRNKKNFYFNEKLFKSLKKNKKSFSQNLKICLNGGEPLVYWKTLKKIIPKIREIFPSNGISITTNGSLLTKDKIDFLIKFNCKITISYDGNDSDRGIDILENNEICDSLNYCLSKKEKFINFKITVSEKTEPFYKISKRIKEKIYFPVKLEIGSFVHCGTQLISKEKKYDSKESLDYFFNLNDSKIDKISKMIVSSKSNFNNSCGEAIGKILTLDLNGNILKCLNCPDEIFGQIDDLKNIKIKGFYSIFKRKKCKECIFLSFCSGVCPSIKEEDSFAFKVDCNNQKYYNEVLFERILKKIFNYKLINFEKEKNEKIRNTF